VFEVAEAHRAAERRWVPRALCRLLPDSGRDCLISDRDCLISDRDYLISGRDCLISGRDCLTMLEVAEAHRAAERRWVARALCRLLV